MSFDGNDYEVSSFIFHEVIRFEMIRDFIFENYMVILDCRGIDKQIVNCANIDSCTKESCNRCRFVFSELILAIDCLINNTKASLEYFDAKKINERNSLITQITQINDISKEHIKIMLRTKLGKIDSDIYKEKQEINALIVYFLDAKIRFINAIEQTVKLYFDYHLSRINYYLESMPKSRSTVPVHLLNNILNLCNSSILNFYDKYRNDATCQKTIYEKQCDYLHKTPLALEITRVEYATRGVLIDTDAANVDYKKQWVTKKEWDAFAKAITIAQDAISIVSTDQEVKQELEALHLAYTLFESAKKYGSYIDTTMLDKALNIAEDKRKSVIISDNSDKVYYKNVWVTRNELKQLNDAIKKAHERKTVVCNDEQVSIVTEFLSKAVAAFEKNKKKGTYVDKAPLQAVIIKAEREIENVEISMSATNVDYKKMWVQQDKWEAFVSAIEMAKNELPVVSTDEEVREATDTLIKEVEDFCNIKRSGNHVDKIILETVIKGAENEIENVYISGTGADVDRKKWWVTQDEYHKFRDLLKNITRICENITTDEQVLEETNRLKEKMANFRNLKKKGKLVDTSLLEKAIKNAEEAQKDIVIDIDADNVDDRRSWVTQKEYDDLVEKIILAKSKLPLLITDEEVTKTIDSLLAATVAFDNCKKKGSFVDKSIISKEILKAENSMRGVLVDEDSANVSYKNDWVTQKSLDALMDAIESAQDSIKNVLTYKQVKNAAKRMREAVDSFNKSKQKGSFVNTAILSRVMKRAEKKLESISVDEDGGNVMKNRLWVTKEDWDRFNIAIVEARNVISVVKNDEQVVEAAEILVSAIDDFDSVLKFGCMGERGTDDVSE